MVSETRSRTACPLPALVAEREAWRAAGQSVVLTNGCFDLLHPGHVALLEAARREGDCLVVALNSDASVRRLKGEGRPIVPAAERAELLLALEPVTRVVVYEQDTPLEVVRALLPDVLVKGADWAHDAIVGRAEVETAGGRVVRSGARPRPLHLVDRRAHPPPVSRTASPALGTLPEWLAGVAELPALAAARERLEAVGRVALSGPSGPARALLPLLLGAPPLLVVVPRERDVDELAQDLRTLAAEAGLAGAVLALPAPGPPPFRGLPRHADASARRAAALLSAAGGDVRALVASPYGLLRPSLAPHLLATRVVSLRAGDEMTPEILLEALDEGGYRREDPVTAAGQVARRGGIVDVFPSERDEPVRIEFFGDTVESLRRFDPDTQRASGAVDALVTLPLADVFATRSVLKALRALLPERFAGRRELAGLLESLERGLVPDGLVDLVPLVGGATVPPWTHLPSATVVVIEPELVRQEAEGFWRARRRTTSAAPTDSSRRSRKRSSAPRRWGRGSARRRRRAARARRASPGSSPSPAGRLPTTRATCAGWPRTCAARRPRTVVFLGNTGRADRLADVLREDGLAVGEGTRILTRVGALSRGFELPEAGLTVLADGDVFPEEVHLHARGRRRGLRSFLSDFRDLKTGDLVVHEEHGIGRFLGLETLDVGGATREFMVLAYHGGDKLKVPVEAFDRIQKYSSAEGARPHIDKLGSGTWEKTKTRVKKAMRDMAKELLRLYAERKARPGHAFTRREPVAARVRGGVRVRGDARPGAGDRRRRARHGRPRADGPAGVRRRRLRQDRGRDARGHARRARRQAGGGARAHDGARLPALEDLPQALRALPGDGRDALALPQRRRRSRPCSPRWPPAASTC